MISIQNKLMPMPHQIEGIDAAINYFYSHHSDNKNKNRGKIIMPPGSGKTYLSLWLMEKMRNLFGVSRTIITVPNLILQGQIFNTFFSEFSSTHKIICIGSNKDIKGGQVQGVEVTTKANEIEDFLKANTQDVIVIVTYQSIGVLSDICNYLNYNFHLGIIDEAHHTAGSEKKPFSKILFDKNIFIRKRLFLTATEKIYNGKKDQIIAMNNPEYYGETIYNYFLPKAIDDGVLCPYQILTICSTNKELYNFLSHNSYIDYKNIDLNDRDKENMLCALFTTIKVIREKGCKKIVTYHSTVKKAKIFKDIMEQIIGRNLLGIGAFHINGVNQPMKERLQNMSDFQSSFISILTNSQALVEGVDMPCIDCIVFADKKESTIQVVQAVGRSLRRFAGKNESCIVVPILTSTPTDINMFNPEYAGLLNILISLAIIDHRLMNQLKYGVSAGQKRILEQRIELDNQYKDKINDLISKLHLKIWKKLQQIANYQEAEEWVIKNLIPIGIDTYKKWHQYMSGDMENMPIPPFDIPKNPDNLYKNKGWEGWDKWFGRRIANKNYWTKEQCIEEGKKYKSQIEWKTNCYSSYSKAIREKWMNECCMHMDGRKIHHKRTKEDCIESARKYNTKEEWRINCNAAVSKARKMGWYAECCQHMIQTSIPSGYWTKDKCLEESKKYKTRKEWGRKSPTSNRIARENGWYVECCKHMQEFMKPQNYWTKERCIEDAQKYKTKTEWQKLGHPGCYTKAWRSKWMEECCRHMKEVMKPRKYWTKERCLADAKKYKTRGEWHKSGGYGYGTSIKNGWLEECCKHMESNHYQNNYWTKERCITEAKKYQTKKEYKRGHRSGFHSARKNEWLEECCEHMKSEPKISSKWTKEMCIEEARKYKTFVEWFDAPKNGYSAAKSGGWIKLCTKHMEKFTKWTKENCIEDARKYKSRKEWRKTPKSSYQPARINGWLEECKKHINK